MSICLCMQAISEEQAKAIQSGRLQAHEIVIDSFFNMPPSPISGGMVVFGCMFSIAGPFVFLLAIHNFGLLYGTLTAIGLLAPMIFQSVKEIRLQNQHFAELLKNRDQLMVIPDECEIGLYKWDALHNHILADEEADDDDPRNFLMCGGEDLPEEEGDEFGPPRLVAPEAVRKCQSMLKQLDIAQEVKRLRQLPGRRKISHWNDETSEQAITEEFEILSKFIDQAVNQNRSVLIAMG